MKNGLIAKLLISSTIIFAAGAVGTVGILSVLSDIITTTGSFTATANTPVTDTLDIAGAYQVYLNGSSTPEATNDVTLNPGDIAVIKATITNYGNNSTWVKDTMDFSATSFVSIASGEHTANDFETGTPTITGGIYQFFGVSGEGVTSTGTTTRVLNGTGDGAQLETADNATSSLLADTNYNSNIFTGTNAYNLAYTLYFDPDNATTGSEVATFTAKTMALQYRENNTSVPVVTCDTAEPPVCTDPWSVVVSSPVGL